MNVRVLRDDLLQGRVIALAGSVGDSVRDALSLSGAAIAAGDQPPSVLVYDGGDAFGTGGEEGLRTLLSSVWDAILPVATGALIPREGPGKLVLIAPRPDAGPYAGAARAALQNLARTLSVEWARYGVTAVALAPGSRTRDEQLATLIAFLCSRAGEYFSGSTFELGVAFQP
jgi:NAD(P)-dependent dehydrogenase (short-subunit alcohol dehydrogenase family)